jgi:hypothetical protein
VLRNEKTKHGKEKKKKTSASGQRNRLFTVRHLTA